MVAGTRALRPTGGPRLGLGLGLGLVLGTTEDACTVFADGRAGVVPYADAFPRPRGERVAPGQLVGVAAPTPDTAFVVWRWFDAVVLEAPDTPGEPVVLWEPGHGQVVARARNPRQPYLPGGRAYLSAGLPGADWWVEGPAVARAEDADVDLVELQRFLDDVGIWSSLTATP